MDFFWSFKLAGKNKYKNEFFFIRWYTFLFNEFQTTVW
jgi:hypothetical protein